MAWISRFKIAVLATDGVEQAELTEPVQALKAAGAGQVCVIAPGARQIQAMNGQRTGEQRTGEMLTVDATLDEVKPSMFHALVLPGGMANADRLRSIPKAVLFAHFFAQEGKPIAAISYASWMLMEIGALRSRLVTAPPSLRTDVTNAGAVWLDRPVVLDAPILTGRGPDDVQAFCQQLVQFFEDPAAPLGAAYDTAEFDRILKPEFDRLFPARAS